MGHKAYHKQHMPTERYTCPMCTYTHAHRCMNTDTYVHPHIGTKTEKIEKEENGKG